MPVSVVCPSCSAKLKAPDHLAGRSISCPKCRASIPVPDESAIEVEPLPTRKKPNRPAEDDIQEATPAPRRRPSQRRDREEEPDDTSTPPRSQAGLIAAVAGGGALLLVLLGGGVAAWLWTRPTQQAGQPEGPAITPQPVVTPVGGAKDTRPEPFEAAALLERFHKDPTAQATLVGKRLEVSGIVAKVAPLAFGDIRGELRGRDVGGLTVACGFTGEEVKKATGVKPGQSVVIIGTCSGKGTTLRGDGATNVVVHTCSLVRASDAAPGSDSTWLDISKAATNSFGISVQVKGVESGPVMVYQQSLPGIYYLSTTGTKVVPTISRSVPSSEEYLLIRLAVANSGRFAGAYTPPRKSKKPKPGVKEMTLIDEKGNPFPPANIGFIMGQSLGAMLNPGQKTEDLLVFSAQNLGKGQHLLLELPGRIAGDDAPIRFKLDQAAVAKRPAPTEAAPPENTAALRSLCSGLLKEDTRASASAELAKANPALHKLVLPIIVSKNYDERIAAVRHLGEMGRAAAPAVPVILYFKKEVLKLAPARAQEMDPNIRQWVNSAERDGTLIIQALVRAAPGETQLSGALARWMVGDRNAGVRAASAQALLWADGGKEKVSDLAQALRVEQHAGLRVGIAAVLGRMGRDARLAAGALAEVVKKDSDEQVRVAAATALGECGSSAKDTVAALSAATVDSSERVRTAATMALEKVRAVPADEAPASTPEDKETAERVAALSKELKDKKPAKRLKAIEGLAALGLKGKGASRALCDSLFDPVPAVAAAALAALKTVNPSLHQPVATLVVHPAGVPQSTLGVQRTKAVARIGQMGSEGRPAVPVLVAHKLWASKAGFIQEPVVTALAQVAADDPAVADLFVVWLLRDLDASVRLAVAKALPGMAATKDKVAALTQAARADRSPQVREAAKMALAKVKG